jgi:hypothetical protein
MKILKRIITVFAAVVCLSSQLHAIVEIFQENSSDDVKIVTFRNHFSDLLGEIDFSASPVNFATLTKACCDELNDPVYTSLRDKYKKSQQVAVAINEGRSKKITCGSCGGAILTKMVYLIIDAIVNQAEQQASIKAYFSETPNATYLFAEIEKVVPHPQYVSQASEWWQQWVTETVTLCQRAKVKESSKASISLTAASTPSTIALSEETCKKLEEIEARIIAKTTTKVLKKLAALGAALAPAALGELSIGAKLLLCTTACPAAGGLLFGQMVLLVPTAGLVYLAHKLTE